MACMMAGVWSSGAEARWRPEHEGEDAVAAYLEAVRASAPTRGRRPAPPAAIPDIFGQGSVLNVGNLVMKVTNNGWVGNPFKNLSSDPSGQWPGATGIEYVNFVGIAMGAVNPFATDPTSVRRVSFGLLPAEWRPASLDPEDRMYRGYDGLVNGNRFVNDDNDTDPLTGDLRYDEEFLDGRDNDGDGRVDEDFAGIGQQMYTCVIRDDTPQAIAAARGERHVPLGVEVWQTAWAYSIPGFTDFNVIHWRFFNRSGHELDSVVIGFRVDMDCGPGDGDNFFNDDFDAPMYPFGRFLIETPPTDMRRQERGTYPPVPDVSADSALCPRYLISVNGFSVADDDGDNGITPGSPHFLLIDHSVDRKGVRGPRTVGFRSFRSFVNGTPFVQGGNPVIDQQRFEMLAGQDNISQDPAVPAMRGFITAATGDQKGDYSEWASIGPWRHWDGREPIECTVALGVRRGDLRLAQAYADDYLRSVVQVGIDPATQEPVMAVTQGSELIARYPALDNAIAAQLAFEGVYTARPWPQLPDAPGRETAVRLPPGQADMEQGCEAHDQVPRPVNDQRTDWFDFDCDYCTGAYRTGTGGLFHHTWLAESPPPSPNTNLATDYNYTDNPGRRIPPAGDQQVTVAWDNLSENTPDPKTGQFDFRSYRIWKVSGWTRPVGSSGPAEDDWTLLAEYRMFDHAEDNRRLENGVPQCPKIWVPQRQESLRVCLRRGDLWDPQSGDVLRPDTTLPCVGFPDCVVDEGLALGSTRTLQRTRYPVGRYRYVDRNVKNGFTYFYSVTGADSTGLGGNRVELSGRRAAVESEAVVPQGSERQGRGVWVVPNPYRGVRAIAERPSSWDLTPNAADPTGTHIDFMGLPPGGWIIRIFTLSGDLVTTLRSSDAVNESQRPGTVLDAQGQPHASVTRQQDTAADGQARWNLITRNGQDIVSGIYLYTVESRRGTERGRFVVIR